ncbi:RHS repeat-associated core domain-containing protein, partial [Pseudoalteromonas luteoviolacea]
AYTGHEPVALGGEKRIIHMNGRIFDADTGRFMQADPFVQAPTNLQNYNAYSYVLNNPLSYTDPSGYLFKKVHDFSKKIRRQVIRGASKVFGAQVVSIVGNILTVFCGPAQAACAAAWNYEFTRAMGGSVSQALKAGLTAAVTAGAGQSIGFQSYSAQFVFDGVVGGIMADVNGGNFGHAFWAAGLNTLLGGGGNYTQNPITNVVISAAVGGTISEVTGGKFRNGAYSAAFTSAMRQDWSSLGPKSSSGRTGSVCSANPINISTGEKYFTMRDYQAAGNSRLKFERYYFSYSKTKSSLGMGWSHNFDRKLEFIKGNKQLIRYLGLNKKELTFSRKNNKHDSYENTANSSEHLQQIDSGWALKLIDGTTEIFNEQGRLMEVHEIGLYQQFLKYNNKGMLTSVTDSMGVEIHLEYNLAGLLTKLETPEGTFEYEYNLANRTLVKALRPASQDGERGYKKYHYGNYDYRSAITHISNEQGNILHRVRYDDNGRAVSSALGSDIEKVNIRFLPNNQSIVTNSLGFKTTYTFNDSNQPLNVAGDGGTSCLSTNQKYEYDSRGNVIKSTDWNGVVTTYSYNDRDLEISRTEALGTDIERATLTEWHDVYPIKKLIQTEKAKQVFEYSDSGLLLSHTTFDLTAEQSWLQNLMEVFPSRTTHYDYNSRGLVVEVDGPRTDVADVTTYEYDELGNQISVTNALGHKTEVTKHNPSGRPLVITHANGSMTELTYNESGWVSSKTKVTSVDAKVVKATTFYEYANSGDNLGQGLIKRIVYPNGGVTAYTYDEAYRVKTMSNHLGEKVEYVRDLEGNPIRTNVFSHSGELVKQQRQQFNELSQLIASVGMNSQVSYQYNGNGQVTATTNGLGNTTQHAFDALNRLVQTIDADGGIVYQTYDTEDQLTHFTDQRGLTTEYQYNGFGEKVRQVSPDTGTTVYKHNAAGLVIETLDNLGQKVGYEYDAIGRITHVSYPDAANEDVFYRYDEPSRGSNLTSKERVKYSAIGQLTNVVDNSGSSQYQYNALGQLVEHTYQVQGKRFTQYFNYADDGLLESRVYPSGMVIRYNYDNAGRVNTISSNSFEDRKTSFVADVEYQAFEAPEVITFGNGVSQKNTYDLDGQFESIQLVNGLNSLLNRYYVYNAADQITDIISLKNDGASQHFEYDNLGRLTSAKGEYGQLTYGYDQVGNRLNRKWVSKDRQVLEDETYQYAMNSNQLQWVAPSVKPVRVFNYNENGQTILDTLKGKSLVYNAANRLSKIAFKDGSHVEYIYNAKGQRVAKVLVAVNGQKTTTHYHFDQDNLLIAESNADGKPLVEYVYLNKQRVASIRSIGGSYVIEYMHNDHLGSPMAQTNGLGELTWQSHTLPFGQSYKPVKSEQGFGFPGQYHDGESSYSYNYFRDYDPSIGRYIQSDPIGIAGGVNTYGYVGGNPIKHIDILGLWYDTDDSIKPRWLTGIKVHSRVSSWARAEGYQADTGLGGLFGLGKRGGFLRPDIIAENPYGGGRLWEIKPMSYQSGNKYSLATSQLSTYIENAKWDGHMWSRGGANELLGEGNDFAFAGTIKTLNGEYRAVMLHRDKNGDKTGLLFYTLEELEHCK